MDHIAIDIGASGGRLFSGKVTCDTRSSASHPEIQINEIYRFQNSMVRNQGHSFWDMDRLFDHIVKGLQQALKNGIKRCTVGIDTWGVDYVLIDRHGNRVADVFSYRDSRTDNAMDSFHESLSKEDIYQKTGIQFLQFNTLYQLFMHDREELKKAWKILLIPDYLYFLFTGKCYNEETNASTTQMLNLSQKDFDRDFLSFLDLDRNLFAELIKPGKLIGKIRPEIRQEYNLPECDFISAATHDTSSAVIGTPILEDDSVYLSSGTWSLMGVENESPVNSHDALEHNFTNEWGAGDTYRFLKNLTGLWLLQEVKRNYDDRFSFETLIEKAKASKGFRFLINCNDNRFLNPSNMVNAVKDYCSVTGQGTPGSEGEVARCIIDSLALSYRYTVEEIEQLTERKVNRINIIGGGVKNRFLCQTTADVSGRKVTAGPVEATVLGNLIMQMIASGEIGGIAEARRIVSESYAPDEYMPQKSPEADDAYERYKKLVNPRVPDE